MVYGLGQRRNKNTALEGVVSYKKYMKDHDGEIILEYHPRALWNGADFALDVCDAVADAWVPKDNKI